MQIYEKNSLRMPIFFLKIELTYVDQRTNVVLNSNNIKNNNKKSTIDAQSFKNTT